MAIARKGTRRIIVAGTPYRWKLRGRPTYDQGVAASPLTFVVEHAEQPGALLVASLPFAHPSNWMCVPAVAVRPRTVAAAIKSALAHGWRPMQPGPAFMLALDRSAIED